MRDTASANWVSPQRQRGRPPRAFASTEDRPARSCRTISRDCRQPPGTSSPGSRFAGSSEGLHCFRRPMASRRYERVAIGDVDLRQSLTYSGRAGRPPRRGARPVRHLDRLAEMGDRLLEGRAAQRLIAGFAPPFDRGFGERRLREVMRHELRLGCGTVGKLVAQYLGDATVKIWRRL